MKAEPKPIVITLTISPVKDGKRKIVVSGAPEQEMPVLRGGTFAELHALVDQVWLALSKREPQVVNAVATPSPAKKAKPKGKMTEETPTSQVTEPAEVDAADTETDDAVKDPTPETPTAEAAPEPADPQTTAVTAKALPVIEGDPTAPSETQLVLEGVKDE